MNKPDLLITQHLSCDYPLWRRWLSFYHDWFDNIIIYFSQHHRYPYVGHFIQSELSYLNNITFLDPVEYHYSTEDWRNVSTNEMLKYSGSEWVCSIEQDFLSRDWETLLSLCEKAMQVSDLFGWMNPTNNPYVHPSFFFAKREFIEKAGCDFTPHPEINGGDHFAAITWKARELKANITELSVGNVAPDSLAFHLGGINTNYLDAINSGNIHRPDIFSVYNYFCLQERNQHPEFYKLMKKVEEKLPAKKEDIEKWRMFFE